ncbi:MAG: hypothetical protein L0271_21700 [Gemmatimonadetes bacterium]|nr:hypothetical protein [Gemmatimonadota bacterium]
MRAFLNAWFRCRSFALAIAPICIIIPISADTAEAQVRGQPVYFEPAYAYDARAGIDASHFGETGGSTITASGSVQIWAGNCRRFSISGAAGIVNPRGPIGARFTGAAGAQVLLNPCPSPLSVSVLTFRFVTGAGLVRGDGESAWNVPIGLGAGWKVEFPVVQIEPWVVIHGLYRQPLRDGEASEEEDGRSASWTGVVSAGLTFGLGEIAGLRAAGTCCKGGIGLGYGVSLWF